MFQELFQQVILSGDPNQLMELWRSQPCHLDTILQLSEYLRMIGQKESCADLLQR